MNLQEARDTIDMLYGFPMTVISDCLRGFVCAAPGKKLMAIDLSQIEGRMLPWLAGQDNKLELFAKGEDLYIAAAQDIYGCGPEAIDSDKRLIGKVSELALGYQGGVGAFQSMAKNYQLKIPDALADEIKLRWREGNPDIVAYWYKLENAACAAVKAPGEKFHVGPKGRHVTYLKKGSFLFCKLPSGRVISYPYPKFRVMTMPWGDRKEVLTYKGEKDHKWVVIAAYGGLLAENNTQAAARDILRDAMFRLEAAGFPIVMHVHDEIVMEVDKHDPVKTLKRAEELMCVVPEWAKGLPIAADGWEGKRYRK